MKSYSFSRCLVLVWEKVQYISNNKKSFSMVYQYLIHAPTNDTITFAGRFDHSRQTTLRPLTRLHLFHPLLPGDTQH